MIKFYCNECFEFWPFKNSKITGQYTYSSQNSKPVLKHSSEVSAASLHSPCHRVEVERTKGLKQIPSLFTAAERPTLQRPGN